MPTLQITTYVKNCILSFFCSINHTPYYRYLFKYEISSTQVQN